MHRLLFCIITLAFSIKGISQSLFSSSPTIGNYVSCPTNANCTSLGINYIGGEVRMGVASISGNSVTFIVKKCNGSSFLKGGIIKLRNAACGTDLDSWSYQSGVSTIQVTYSLPNSFTSGSQQYYILLHSFSGDKLIAGSVNITATPPPATPTNFVATSNCQTVNLMWSAVINGDQYIIDREIAGQIGSAVTIGTATGTSFSDNSISPNSNYQYFITAKNTNTQQTSLTPASVTISTPSNSPATPSGFAAVASSASSVNLSWSDVACETGYEIYLSENGNPFSLYTTVGADVSSYHHTGLSASTSYCYHIRSINSNVNTSSGASTPKCVTTSSNGPNAPTNLVVAATNSATHSLSWVDVPNETGYKVYRKPNLGGVNSYGEIASKNANETTHTDPSLNASTQYCYYIVAFNANGVSGQSNEVCRSPVQSSIALSVSMPSSNQNVNLGSSLNISWNTPNSAGSNVSIELVNSSTNTVVYAIADPTANDGSHAWIIPNGAVPPGQYKIKMYPTGTTGQGVYSAVFNVLSSTTASFTITTPNGGQTFAAGGTIPSIAWTSQNIAGNINIYLADANGSPLTTIASNIPNISPRANWVIPNTTITGQYKIKITAVNNTVSDVSDNFFTINGSAANQSCTITNPASTTGEEYSAALFLCQNGIIDNPNGGNINPSNPIIREDLAKIMYKGLFLNNVPNFITADVEKFPVPFGDLNGTDSYQKYARVLSYLEYGDGRSPFTRNNYFFNPGANIQRSLVCKVLVETFNIPLSNSTALAGGVSSSHPDFKYIRTCYDFNIAMASDFRPDDNATRMEAFLMLYRCLTNASVLNWRE